MAKYYYVKNGTGNLAASADTSYSSLQTGSFPALANCYASIGDALSTAKTTDPADGDYIIISDAHSYSWSANQTWSLPASADLKFIVVSDSACDTPTPATTYLEDGSGGSWDVSITAGGSDSNAYFYGMWFIVGDDVLVSMANSRLTFDSCNIKAQGDGDLLFSCTTAEGYIVFRNTVFDRNSGTSGCLKPGSGNLVEFIHCDFQNSTAALFSSNSFTSTGNIVKFIGCDFSDITSPVFDGVISGATTGFVQIEALGCRMNASSSYTTDTFLTGNQRLLVANCGLSSGAQLYQYYNQSNGGVVEEQDDTGIFRNESTAYPDGTQISLKCVTAASSISINSPFAFEFPTKWAPLSSTSTDTITLYLASTASLTDADVGVEIHWSDGTTENQYNYHSTRHGDIFTAGTALTTDSGSTWKNGASDLVGYNEYKIDVNTGTVDAGADCIPIIRVYVTKASTTIYFCPTLGLS